MECASRNGAQDARQVEHLAPWRDANATLIKSYAAMVGVQGGVEHLAHRAHQRWGRQLYPSLQRRMRPCQGVPTISVSPLRMRSGRAASSAACGLVPVGTTQTATPAA